MFTVSSADGTTIAYDKSGSGAPLILIGGALCDRTATRPLAQHLAEDFTVVSYDRRGRGDSGDTSRYSVAREVDDLGALITALGGTAAVYGHSSGAALLIEAAASGLPITKIALHEPPYGPSDEESDAGAARVIDLLAQNRRTDAVTTFLSMTGMPDEMAAQYAKEFGMAEIAHTLPYDFAVVDSSGGDVPFDQLAKVFQPSLVICGSASPPFIIDSARILSKGLPGGRLVELDGHHHVVPPEVLAPVLVDFFSRR